MSNQQQYEYSDSEQGMGWIGFAGFMLILGGTFGFIDGLVAVSKSKFYVAGARYVFSDLHLWGIIIMIVGALTVLAGFYVFTGSQWARWFGIAIASLQAIAQLLMIQAYPFWSLCVFAIDLLVIYGLSAYGGKPRRA
jgi:hypothetical protein